MTSSISRLRLGPERSRASGLLFALGTAATLIYVVFLSARYPLFSLWQTPSLDLGTATSHGRLEGMVFLALTLAVFAIYALALRTVAATPFDRQLMRVVFVFGLLQAGAMMLAFPVGSTDMVSYTLQARVFTEHGANPHLVPPSAFPGDPLYPYMTYWFDEPSIYGPLWTLLITPLSLLAGDDMLLHYLLFKLLAIFALQGSAVLAAQIVARLGNGYAMAAFLGVAWNPLLLFECGANGHNDIIMAFLALLTLHCVGLNRPVAALLSLTASVLVKFVTALLAPFVLLAVCGEAVRRIVSWRRLVVGLGLSLALVVVSYLPFWQGLQTIGFLQRSTFYTTSPAAVAYFWLYDLGQPGLAALASWPGYLLFAAVAACLWVSWVRGATLLSDGMFDVMLAYLLLATPWFQPWYLCLLVPLAAVTSGAFRRLLAYVFSLSAALQYFAFNFLWSWNRQAWEMKEGQLLMTAIVFLPVWLLLVWRFVASLRRGGSSF